jgi:hypothetical protein
MRRKENFMSSYTSSLIFNYGDIDKVKSDFKILDDILKRQGISLLIEVIAEHVGDCSLKYAFSDLEKNRFQGDLISEFNNAICERI